MNFVTTKSPVVITQNLIWGDMDAFQHINNTVFFRYFEDARIAYFEQAGVLQLMAEEKIGPILASTRCDFKKPLVYPDKIHITANVVDFAAKRFTMKYQVYSERHSGLAALGEGLIVYFDYQKMHSCPVPKRIHAAMRGMEAGCQ